MKLKFDPLLWENAEQLANKHRHLITTFSLSDFEVSSEDEPFNLEINLPKDKLQRITELRKQKLLIK